MKLLLSKCYLLTVLTIIVGAPQSRAGLFGSVGDVFDLNGGNAAGMAGSILASAHGHNRFGGSFVTSQEVKVVGDITVTAGLLHVNRVALQRSFIAGRGVIHQSLIAGHVSVTVGAAVLNEVNANGVQAGSLIARQQIVTGYIDVTYGALLANVAWSTGGISANLTKTIAIPAIEVFDYILTINATTQ